MVLEKDSIEQTLLTNNQQPTTNNHITVPPCLLFRKSFLSLVQLSGVDDVMPQTVEASYY